MRLMKYSSPSCHSSRSRSVHYIVGVGAGAGGSAEEAAGAGGSFSQRAKGERGPEGRARKASRGRARGASSSSTVAVGVAAAAVAVAAIVILTDNDDDDDDVPTISLQHGTKNLASPRWIIAKSETYILQPGASLFASDSRYFASALGKDGRVSEKPKRPRRSRCASRIAHSSTLAAALQNSAENHRLIFLSVARAGGRMRFLRARSPYAPRTRTENFSNERRIGFHRIIDHHRPTSAPRGGEVFQAICLGLRLGQV